jgi:CRP/FNR family cyclic AMP-dependent transcriptional regulator
MTALERWEPDVTRIARRHPELWRHIAVEIAARLRERTKYISTPNVSPVIFIGSSSEALNEATWLLKSLNRRPAVCRIWTQGVFQLSNTTIEDLLRQTAECDFAVLLLTPDDMTRSRGRQKASPRDNAVFELGLFMGALGRQQTFIVAPRSLDLKLPTDLLGVTRLPFAAGPKRTLGRRLQPVSRALWSRINELWPRIAGEYK